jgi:hypothetical protein
MTASNAFFLAANWGFNFRLFIVATFRFQNWFPFLEVRNQFSQQRERWQRLAPFKTSNDKFVASVAENPSVALPTKFLEPARATLMKVILEGRVVVEVSSAARA